MTPSPPTAATLLTNLRRAGVMLTANGDRLAFDAPAGAMTSAVQAMLKARKPELLAVLRGDYMNAAAALVLTVSDAEQRAELAYLFDERAGICKYDGGMGRGKAERQAYIESARAVDAQNAAAVFQPVGKTILPGDQAKAVGHDADCQNGSDTCHLH